MRYPAAGVGSSVNEGEFFYAKGMRIKKGGEIGDRQWTDYEPNVAGLSHCLIHLMTSFSSVGRSNARKQCPWITMSYSFDERWLTINPFNSL